jgi:hypothetical protein
MRAVLIATAVVGIVSATATVGFSQAKSSGSQSLEGVWKATSIEVTGANPSVNANRQPSLVIYTKKYFSVITLDGSVPLPPRSQLTAPKDPDHLTDAEKLARYEAWLPVLAQSGTYTVKGNVLVQHRLISKDPASMNTEGGPIEFKINGNTMTQVTKSLPGQPVSETHRTYTRLE